MNSGDKLIKLRDRWLKPEIRTQTPDIYTFQESHSSPEVEKVWNLVLPGHVVYAHGPEGRKGILLGVHPGSPARIHSSVSDKEGRYIVANCEVKDERFTVVSVYIAPNYTVDMYRSLLNEIASCIEVFGNNRVVWAGDFNVCMSKTQDCYRDHSVFEQRRRVLFPFLDAQELTDVWRSMHPFETRYTHFTRTPQAFALTRLDYIFTSPAFLTSVVNSNIGNLYMTDHSPLTLDFLIKHETPGKGYWKFPEFLLSDEEFSAGLKKRIPQLVEENPGADPALLWDTVKCGIRSFAIEYLAANKRERKKIIEKIESQISEATLLRDTMTHDPYKVQFYKDKVQSLQEQLDQTFFKLNNKARQLQDAQKHYESNRCTKFYFTQPGRKNDAIKCLFNKQGDRVFEPKGILYECKQFYDSLYKQPNVAIDSDVQKKFLAHIPKTVLNDVGISALSTEINLDEVHEALKSMKKRSVPGLDGLTVEFYVTHWNLVKDLLFASYTFAFQTKKLSLSQRRGIIRLIPKQDQNPLFVSSWRPISLLQVDFKILTKLFAKRLSLFLPDMIHADQKGFIQGRSIHENLVDIQAVMAACEDQSTESVLLLLDIHKAFDSVGWSFLRSVLREFQFPEYFISWFDIFYAGKELRVTNNGLLSDPIFPECGVAQGCCISPLFFILAIEVLALALRENPKIEGIILFKYTKKLNFLADDGILTLRWTQGTLDELLKVLQDFSFVSNLTVNKHKSVIVPLSGESLSPLQGMEYFKVCREGTFRYLGIDWDVRTPTIPRAKTSVQNNLYAPVSEIRSIANTRNEYFHTTLGRILNVKILMVSRLTYKLSALPSPSMAWFHKLQSYLNDYIWKNKKHHLAAKWCYQPIEQGGLNMINICWQDQALKLSWISKALFSPPAFWSAQLRDCLPLPLEDWLCCNISPSHVYWSVKQSLNPLCKAVLKHWCTLHFTPNGNHVGLLRIGFNSVLAKNKFRCVFNTSYLAKLEAIGLHSVSDLIDEFDNFNASQKKTLHLTRLMDMLPSEWLTQVDSGNYGDMPEIEKLMFKPFTVHQCYELIRVHSDPGPVRAIAQWETELECDGLASQWKNICSLYKVVIPVKIREFHIKFVNRLYPMNNVIAKYMPTCSDQCPFCNNVKDSVVHSFWECYKIKHLWEELIAFCKDKVSATETYSKKNCLLLGFKNPVLDYVTILCKYHIHMLRFFRDDFTFEALRKRIFRAKTLDLLAFKNLRLVSAKKTVAVWKQID